MTHFKDLNLSAKIVATLEKKGYTSPTPIQEKSIPHVLERKDILGIAQTGTGKTASFSLPILDILSQDKVSSKGKTTPVRSLILTPTRELASQIVDNIKAYGQGMGLSCTAIFGGVSINNQIRDMKRGFDIIVATPGRLIDLMDRKAVNLSQVEILVLDEADRMLDMGFVRDVKKIISKVPKQRQTLFFSATMPRTVSGLAESILDNPVKVEVTPQSTTVEKIDQRVILIPKEQKRSVLKSILLQDDVTSVLVFSKTKHGANRIGQFLEGEGIKAAAIHGNKSQAAREKALKDFKNDKVKVLIATDIAARGIDIPAISHVINFDIPHDPENYVHRIGRTARAGRNGIAISLCDYREKSLLKAIEKTIKYTIPVEKTGDFSDEGDKFAEKYPEPRRLSRGPSSGRRSSDNNGSRGKTRKISSGNGAGSGSRGPRSESSGSKNSSGSSWNKGPSDSRSRRGSSEGPNSGKPKRFGEDRRRKDGFEDRKGTAKPSKSYRGGGSSSSGSRGKSSAGGKAKKSGGSFFSRISKSFGGSKKKR